MRKFSGEARRAAGSTNLEPCRRRWRPWIRLLLRPGGRPEPQLEAAFAGLSCGAGSEVRSRVGAWIVVVIAPVEPMLAV